MFIYIYMCDTYLSTCIWNAKAPHIIFFLSVHRTYINMYIYLMCTFFPEPMDDCYYYYFHLVGSVRIGCMWRKTKSCSYIYTQNIYSTAHTYKQRMSESELATAYTAYTHHTYSRVLEKRTMKKRQQQGSIKHNAIRWEGAREREKANESGARAHGYGKRMRSTKNIV